MINKQFINPLNGDDIIRGKEYCYKIVRPIGQGTFGLTYLAEMLKANGEPTGMLICLKEFFMRDINGRNGSTVTKRGDSDLFESYRRKFAREAKNLASVNDENIVSVVEQFDCNDTSYYAMSYIHGGTLDDVVMKAGTLSERQTLEIASVVASALITVHNAGLAHLDLKPSNIMMLNGTIPVLIDFGLSKHFSMEGRPETSTTIGSGTPGYAPMEQSNYSNNGEMPWPMDVYALGATMFKMLTGHRAPDSATIYNDGFPQMELRNLGISTGTISIVRKAMAPIRNMRYQTAAELKSDIEEQLQECNGHLRNYHESEETHYENNRRPQEDVVVAEVFEQSEGNSSYYPHTNDNGGLDNGNAFHVPSEAHAGLSQQSPVDKERRGIPSWVWILILSTAVAVAVFFAIILYRGKDSKQETESAVIENVGTESDVVGEKYTLSQIEGDDMPSEISLTQDGDKVKGVWHTRIVDLKVEGSFSDGDMSIKCRTTSMRLELKDNGNGVLTGTCFGPGDKKSEIAFKRI